jgi:hypothetical protein
MIDAEFKTCSIKEKIMYKKALITSIIPAIALSIAVSTAARAADNGFQDQAGRQVIALETSSHKTAVTPSVAKAAQDKVNTEAGNASGSETGPFEPNVNDVGGN